MKNSDLNKVIVRDSIYGTTIPATPVNDIIVLSEFTDKSIKQSFISKVYSILWIQILFTCVIIYITNQIKEVQTFLLSNIGYNILFFTFFLLLTTTCIFYSSENIQKNHCFKFLFLYTILINYLVSYVGITYSSIILLLSGIITFVIFSGLSLYAIQTKIDYTQYGSILCSSLFSLICFGLITMFFNIPFIQLIYSTLGSLLFSFYIIYDTQLIVDGKHRKLKFSESDYVIAAISLYTDILNLFLFILDILGGGNAN